MQGEVISTPFRYQNHLNKDVKRDEWTEEEELALFRLHNEKGNKWVEIARALERYFR
jgi:myb proto-oncogene protein